MAKKKAVKKAVTPVVQIGRKRDTDVIVPIKVSKKTQRGLAMMADANGVIHMTEEDLLAAVENYLRPKAEAALIELTKVIGAGNKVFDTTPFKKDQASIAEVGQPLAHVVIENDDLVATDSGEINILLEANKIIYGEREQAYGNPRFNLDTIAQFWSTYLQRKFPDGMEPVPHFFFTAEDVAQMMILLKMARLIHNPTHVDSLTDQCGYAALQHRIQGM